MRILNYKFPIDRYALRFFILLWLVWMFSWFHGEFCGVGDGFSLCIAMMQRQEPSAYANLPYVLAPVQRTIHLDGCPLLPDEEIRARCGEGFPLSLFGYRPCKACAARAAGDTATGA